MAPAEVPGDGLDGEPALLEQAVQHAPGEGAVRAATLQRQVDELRRWLGRHGSTPSGKRFENSDHDGA